MRASGKEPARGERRRSSGHRGQCGPHDPRRADPETEREQCGVSGRIDRHPAERGHHAILDQASGGGLRPAVQPIGPRPKPGPGAAAPSRRRAWEADGTPGRPRRRPGPARSPRSGSRCVPAPALSRRSPIRSSRPLMVGRGKRSVRPRAVATARTPPHAMSPHRASPVARTSSPAGPVRVGSRSRWAGRYAAASSSAPTHRRSPRTAAAMEGTGPPLPPLEGRRGRSPRSAIKESEGFTGRPNVAGWLSCTDERII